VGYSQQSGLVIGCDGVEAADKGIAWRLWKDLASGVMRYADGEYSIAKSVRGEMEVRLPMIDSVSY